MKVVLRTSSTHALKVPIKVQSFRLCGPDTFVVQRGFLNFRGPVRMFVCPHTGNLGELYGPDTMRRSAWATVSWTTCPHNPCALFSRSVWPTPAVRIWCLFERYGWMADSHVVSADASGRGLRTNIVSFLRVHVGDALSYVLFFLLLLFVYRELSNKCSNPNVFVTS